MVIDVHAHIIVPEATRRGASDEAWRPRVAWEDGRQLVELGGRTIRAAVREFVHVEGILAEQTRAGVDHVLLCPWVALLGYDLEPEQGLAVCRLQNEALAGLAQAHPERVRALGAVPMQDPEAAAREVERVMRLTGLRGVEVAASVRGVYLGDDRFLPFWAAAEEAGAVVFIHPTTRGFHLPVMDEYYLWNAVGNPLETTITAAHLVLAGVMEAHPSLKLILAHGGGAVLALRGRLAHAHSFQPQAASRLVESPEASLRRFYYDTVVHHPAVLRSLIEAVGAERVLLGSDYPFDMGSERPAEIVAALGLPEAEAAMILGGNAERLLNLETRAWPSS